MLFGAVSGFTAVNTPVHVFWAYMSVFLEVDNRAELPGDRIFVSSTVLDNTKRFPQVVELIYIPASNVGGESIFII